MSLAQDDDDDTSSEETEPADATADEAPDEDSEPDDDSADEDTASKDDSREVAPKDAATDSKPTDRNQAIRDFLTEKYGKAANDSDVKAAIAESRRTNTLANIGHGLETMFRARSQANGGAGVDSGFYNGLKAEGAQGVAQAQAERSAKIRDFLTEQQLGRQGVADQSASARQKVWEDQNTPGSDTAKHVIASFNKTFPKYAISDDDANHLSAADVKGYISGNVDIAAKVDANKELAKSRAQAHADSVATASAIKGDKADAAATDKQNKAYTEMTNRVTGGRGAPQNVTQAQLAQTSVAKAKELIQQAPVDPKTGQPDLNKLSPQQVHMLNAELEKIATGGVPTEAGRAGLDPKTFESQWAVFKNKATGPDGEVSGAELAPFVQQNLNYLEGLGKVTQGVVSKYQRETYDDYADSGRLSEAHKATFQRRHPDLFPETKQVSTPPAAAAPAEGNKQAAVPTPAATHPEANEAFAWAKAHPEDPRSAEIMKRLGSTNAGL